MQIACVYTVKNEEELLPPNLAYHRHLGVTDFFVFLDDSTDATKTRIQNLPGLRLFENLGWEVMERFAQDRPGLDAAIFRSNFHTHSELRQILNGNMAIEQCREDGIDWLLYLDPDELICLDLVRVEEDGLQHLFAGLSPGAGAVWFKNIEAVPTRVEPGTPFEDRLFKSDSFTPGETEYPKSRILNPFTGKAAPAGWFWGHSSGKIALRPAVGAYFLSTHDCHSEGERVTRETLLHYNFCSFRQFLNKYRNFRDFPNRKNARPLRLLLRDVVNHGGFTEEYLLEFYRDNIRYSEEDIAAIKALDAQAFIEINAAADFFAR